MIAAGLGLRRGEDISHLAALNFGVRIDQKGGIESDFHNMTKWKRDTGNDDKKLSLTTRHYLSDYVFLVGLEGDRELLEEIIDALRHPKFHLFLGRKACVPDTPMVIGIDDTGLVESLKSSPWYASEWYKKEYPDSQLEILRDAYPGESGDIIDDLPVNFSRVHREYGKRIVVRDNPVKMSHDPFAAIEES